MDLFVIDTVGEQELLDRKEDEKHSGTFKKRNQRQLNDGSSESDKDEEDEEDSDVEYDYGGN